MTRTQRVRVAVFGTGTASRYLSGPVGVLRILALVLAALGLGYLPFDLADQARARDLEAHGSTVAVQDVRVHVSYVYARGGGWHEVDEVQVRIPGVEHGQWVSVTGLVNFEVNEDLKGTGWREGWQAPTGATTYQAPLEIVYRVADGDTEAMVPGDVAHWSSSDDPAISAGLGAGGVLLTVATFAPAGYRRWRSRTRP